MVHSRSPRHLSSALAPYRVLSIALLLSACGPSDGSSANSTPAASGAASKVAPAKLDAPDAERIGSEPLESGAPASLGALHGEILVRGEVAERFPLGARKFKECSAHADVEHLSDILIVNDGKLEGAFVHILSGHEGAEVPPAPSEPAVMDQRGCIYTPHVLALRTGQKLLVKNSDPATHNVNVKAPRNSASSNVSMVDGGAPLEFTMRRPEEMQFKCDIHPWMSARVHVSDHPWFAVTDADGSFKIRGVPAGEYVVEVVHEQLGTSRGRVVVEAGQSTGFRLTLDAD